MNFDFEERNKKPLAKRILKEVIILAVGIVFVIALAYFIINYTIEKTEVIGSSMETTLSDGDEIIINKIAYRFHDPERFDVVVFKQSNKEHSYYNVKRIIGCPGETVQIVDNTIYINGEAIKDDVIADSMNNAGLASDVITLEENEYFVLGDNRNNSEDSRFANVGNIISDEIVGKAWIKLKPFNFVNKINRVSESDMEEPNNK